jgi:hypothetical protein
VEYKKIGGRQVGANLIPCRAWIDGYDQAWDLLGVRADVEAFRSLADATARSAPRLAPWLARHPMQVLKLADRWDKLLATARWIDERQVPGMYVRQVDVPGVDTKFIEGNKGVLAELLDLQLDQDRIDPAAADFAGRYRFRRKPAYVRFRGCCPDGFTELSVRAEEFTAPPAGARRVYVIENEITYLAFPLPDAAVAIFGGGYAVDVLEPLGWLADLDLVYWGDIDTHGFAILNRLRRRFGHARSMLMDRATLLTHRGQWVTEPRPTAAELDLLDAEEAELYRILVDGALGPSVRLEQERVGFAAIGRALARDRVPAALHLLSDVVPHAVAASRRTAGVGLAGRPGPVRERARPVPQREPADRAGCAAGARAQAPSPPDPGQGNVRLAPPRLPDLDRGAGVVHRYRASRRRKPVHEHRQAVGPRCDCRRAAVPRAGAAGTGGRAAAAAVAR